MKKLLFLSWRDIKHPKKGGAEIFSHEMFKRMVDAGFEIDHIGPLAEGMEENEVVDGVNYIRGGNAFSVIPFARRWYKERENEYDHVIDQCNTHRFFSPLWADKKKLVFFIHQLTREIWFYHTQFPTNVAGYLSESAMLRLYNNLPTITVSDSTKQDLLKLGFKDDKIEVFPEGLNFRAWERSELKPKEDKFTCLYVGRFAKYKGIEDSIKAFAFFHRNNPDSQLWLVGKADKQYQEKLQKMIDTEGMSGKVTFFGFVSHEKKLELMSRSHCILVPSQREGWGLIVTEANAVGTPAIVYDSPGLRDSVRHRQTGLHTHSKTPEAIHEALLELYNDPELLKQLSQNAHDWSQEFHWDNTGKAAIEYFSNQ